MGLDEGWCSERILLIPELQKWKQQALSLQEGTISPKAHQKMMNSLREKWLKEERVREWEEQRNKEAMKKKKEQLQLLQRQVLNLTNERMKL